MDIRPATIDQVAEARDGSTVIVDRDVGDLASRLKELDPSLVLRWHEVTGHWSVVQVYRDKQNREREQLVATCQPIGGGGPHPRLWDEVARVVSPEYDVVDAIDAADKQRDRDRAAAEAEMLGERMERAHFDFRTALNARQDKVFVP